MKQCFLLLALVSFSICEYSGIKVAITSEIFKILTKVDLNSFLQNKTIIDYAEASGQALFNYEVICENLTITDIIAPNNVTIEQEKNTEDLPQVKVTLYNIDISIQIDYLYVKYGLIKETMNNPTGNVVISSLEFRFYFTTEGDLVVNEVNVEIDSLEIDVRKDFLNWLIGLFKGLIKNELTKKLESLGDTISDKFNEWINGEFSYDLGNGFSFNLTNILKPQLSQTIKTGQFGHILLQLAKIFLFNQEEDKSNLQETLTSILTFGVKGSCFPNDNPELMPEFTPSVDMDFNKDYFSNEGQILISTYTLNTLLFMGQNKGYLHKEFNNASHPIFPWNFDTQGLSELFPEFSEKYKDNNLDVEMRAYISIFNHNIPFIESSETGAKLTFNFNLDFLTYVSEDPLDDPIIDLSLNITAELPFTIQVKYDLLTINWGNLNILNLKEKTNELNISHDELIEKIANMWDTYVYKFIKGYTKNVALAAILTLITKMEFKNFKLETKEGFILGSIAANLD